MSSHLVGNVPGVVSPANLTRRFVWLHNASQETVFIKFGEEADPLTTANGFPLGPGKDLSLVNLIPSRPVFRNRIEAVKSGDGTAELRLQEA
jgi:hypothetical protein